MIKMKVHFWLLASFNISWCNKKHDSSNTNSVHLYFVAVLCFSLDIPRRIFVSRTLSHPLEPVRQVTVCQLVGPHSLGCLLGGSWRHYSRRRTFHPSHCRSLGGAQGHASRSHEGRSYRRRCSNSSRSCQCDGLRLGLCNGRSCKRYFETKQVLI